MAKNPAPSAVAKLANVMKAKKAAVQPAAPKPIPSKGSSAPVADSAAKDSSAIAQALKAKQAADALAKQRTAQGIVNPNQPNSDAEAKQRAQADKAAVMLQMKQRQDKLRQNAAQKSAVAANLKAKLKGQAALDKAKSLLGN